MVLPLFFSPRSGFYQPGDILEYREESFIRTFDLRSKVGCISEMKINCDLFCISLDFHYL